MTDAQKFRFYLPPWRDCVKANRWHMEKGRLCGAGLEAPAALTELAQVVTFARQLAATAHRGPLVNDLRHGCHIVALGRDKSSKEFTNAELDRVESLFRLLTDPDDINARLDWEDPTRAAKRRQLWFIRNAAPAAYVRAIARDKFGTADWENLTVAQLKFLAMTLANRRNRKAGTSNAEPRTSNLEPEVPAENCPF